MCFIHRIQHHNQFSKKIQFNKTLPVPQHRLHSPPLPQHFGQFTARQTPIRDLNLAACCLRFDKGLTLRRFSKLSISSPLKIFRKFEQTFFKLRGLSLKSCVPVGPVEIKCLGGGSQPAETGGQSDPGSQTCCQLNIIPTIRHSFGYPPYLLGFWLFGRGRQHLDLLTCNLQWLGRHSLKGS